MLILYLKYVNNNKISILRPDPKQSKIIERFKDRINIIDMSKDKLRTILKHISIPIYKTTLQTIVYKESFRKTSRNR